LYSNFQADSGGCPNLETTSPAAFGKLFFGFCKFGFCKFLVEFVNPACRINEFHFPSEKGMRFARNFQFYQGIFVPIFPHDGISSWCTRPGYKRLIAREIFEDHQAIIFWMNIFFHDNLFLILKTERKDRAFFYFEKAPPGIFAGEMRFLFIFAGQLNFDLK